MSQNSLVLPTSGTLSGLAAVEAINAALDTLNTLSAGASAPSGAEIGQIWHDTANNLLKLRSADNTAWIVLGALDETNHAFNASVKAMPPLYGLALSNDTATAATILDVAPGGAYDSTALVYMRLAASLRKNVTAAFVAGSGNGSLDSGTFQASKFYHVHLIYNATSGAVDVLTSLSYSNPVLPSGFTNFVAIGAIYSNASSNIAAFSQNGDEFLYAANILDVNGNPGTAGALISLTVPGGVKVNALLRGVLESAYTGGGSFLLLQSPDETVSTPGLGNASIACNTYTGSGGTDTFAAGGEFSIRTNTSGQIHVASNITTGSIAYSITTQGFIYPRGLQ